jgi:hypothetical protein
MNIILKFTGTPSKMPKEKEAKYN